MYLDGIRKALEICDIEDGMTDMEWSDISIVHHKKQTAQNIRRLLLDEIEMYECDKNTIKANQNGENIKASSMNIQPGDVFIDNTTHAKITIQKVDGNVVHTMYQSGSKLLPMGINALQKFYTYQPSSNLDIALLPEIKRSAHDLRP